MDIGSKTVDIIHTRKHIPVESDCITIPSALIQCMANINNVVYRKQPHPYRGTDTAGDDVWECAIFG